MNYKTNVKVGKMKTKSMIQQNLVQEKAYRKFEVGCVTCNLEINDQVTPETIVGRHYQTGQIISASCYGQVATIFFNPMHASLMITIIDTTAELRSF